MGTETLEPTVYYTQPGEVPPTLFGAAPDVVTALGDADDTTGVHFGTAWAQYQNFTIAFELAADVLPATARVDWVRVDFRARHVQPYAFVWPASLRAFTKATATPRFRFLPVVRVPSNVAVQAASTAASRTSDEGTPWDDCDVFHVYWGTYGPGDDQLPWDSSNYPYLTKTYLTVGYTLQPTVTDIDPTGTTDDPTPTFTWVIGNLEETPATAHRLIVLPAGSTDANSNAIGDPDFDPTTGSGAGYDSGKTFTSVTTRNVTKALPPGVWWVFVRQWVGSGVSEYASDWASETFTVDALTVDQPGVALTDDTASNTVLVTLTAGSHTEDLVADTIEVEYLDPVYGWVTAPIENGMVNGTGVSTFYDGLHAPDEVVSYRARGVATVDSILYASPWTTATHTVGNLHQWWLRSSSDYTLNRSLHDNAALLMKTWAPARQRPNTTTWGIGARPATVVHDITKGDVHDCSIWAMTKAAYTDLRALIEDQDDLILVNPWGETWRVVAGGEVKEEIMRAAPRSSETTPLGFVRVVNVTFVEVVTP